MSALLLLVYVSYKKTSCDCPVPTSAKLGANLLEEVGRLRIMLNLRCCCLCLGTTILVGGLVDQMGIRLISVQLKLELDRACQLLLAIIIVKAIWGNHT